MKDKSCAYCMTWDDPSLMDAFGIPLKELDHSYLILFKEQSHLGRVIVAAKQHVDDISDLSRQDALDYLSDVRRVAKALRNEFKPQKLNFGAYGDLMHHLHFHLVPKYESDPYEWGDVFAMNPGRTLLTKDEYDALGKRIVAAVDAVSD